MAHRTHSTPQTVQSSTSPTAQRIAAPLPALLQLQRHIGNQAVLRGGSTLVQRINVTGEVEQGVQQHHPNYFFKFGAGEREKYDLDPWITKKGAMNADAFLQEQANTPQDVLQLIQNWNGTGSVVDELINTLLANNPVNDWQNADIKDNVAQGAGGQAMVKHLLAMKSNIALRVADIDNNCPTRVAIHEVRKTPSVNKKTNLAINWTSILANARLLLQQELAAGHQVPDNKDLVRLVDQAIAASADAGIVRLHQTGLLKDDGGQQKFSKKAVVDRIATTATLKNDKISFNFGINHLRFILYLEWRAISELM